MLGAAPNGIDYRRLFQPLSLSCVTFRRAPSTVVGDTALLLSVFLASTKHPFFCSLNGES